MFRFCSLIVKSLFFTQREAVCLLFSNIHTTEWYSARMHLTARMHHNSQKRINTSKLYQDLRDLTLTLQSQKHPSASL